nr:vitelline membrane outer layer protein 1 homolog [Penaeus vannamei]
MKHCSTGFATGMRANVLASQGLLGDDVAVENVEVACDDGTETIVGVEEAKIPMGEWSLWSRCSPGSGVCGIQTRFQNSGLGDDAGVTDVSMYCCSFNGTRVH